MSGKEEVEVKKEVASIEATAVTVRIVLAARGAVNKRLGVVLLLSF